MLEAKTEKRASRRRRVLAPVALAASVLTLGIGSGVAYAAVTDNIVPTANYSPRCIDEGSEPDANGGLCLTDNTDVTYYGDSSGDNMLEAGDKATVNSVMANEYNPTQLNTSYDSSPSFSGSAETDIIYQEGTRNLGSNVLGMAWCNDAVTSSKCDQAYIRIRPGNYSYGISCHETGHAVGLTHGAQAAPRLRQNDSRLGCMQTPVPSGAGLGANNRDNINAAY
ncbi:hypothetical protein [Streptomyces yaizuensis]|uniref:Peptidase M10 metallopeptidase domain-containing protein n=1 Tax=Streptomyces yaizuensis TaxID=2989713 RepID=A0ABQ5P3L7_9ACTN|nr:hypothetical protein [Streptomyces sp. YSPA8]GLF97170.1 hypothetical protein SYYSPA8_22755 [Streptomyces sp. YSPA8]